MVPESRHTRTVITGIAGSRGGKKHPESILESIPESIPKSISKSNRRLFPKCLQKCRNPKIIRKMIKIHMFFQAHRRGVYKPPEYLENVSVKIGSCGFPTAMLRARKLGSFTLLYIIEYYIYITLLYIVHYYISPKDFQGSSVVLGHCAPGAPKV